MALRIGRASARRMVRGCGMRWAPGAGRRAEGGRGERGRAVGMQDGSQDALSREKRSRVRACGGGGARDQAR